MDDEIKTLLKKNLELTKENNIILRKMRRSAIIGNIMRMIWWAMLIGVPVVLYYYYFQPLLGNLYSAYQGIEETGKELTTLPTFSLPEWLKNLFGGK